MKITCNYYQETEQLFDENKTAKQFVSLKTAILFNGAIDKTEIMTQLIKESGCDFLLDISHTFINVCILCLEMSGRFPI